MNITVMRAIVRRDLHDEDAGGYRWTDDELDRHIAHAVADFSEAVPLEDIAAFATTAGSREIDISSLSGRIMVEAVEYPSGRFPKSYQRFSLWANVVTLLGEEVPDGSDANILYGKGHVLGASSSTIPAMYEDLVAGGACGHAAAEWAVYAVNRVNTGGSRTPEEFLEWGCEKLGCFRKELKRLSRRNRARVSSLYRPYYPVASKTTDYGP
jgi:hypothetical protein